MFESRLRGDLAEIEEQLDEIKMTLSELKSDKEKEQNS